MTRFAVGFQSKAICDRCGFMYTYLQLKLEWNGLRTCPECWETKHPQLDPIYPPTEPQALLNPRPDRKEPIDVPVGYDIFPFVQYNLLQGVMQLGVPEVEIT